MQIVKHGIFGYKKPYIECRCGCGCTIESADDLYGVSVSELRFCEPPKYSRESIAYYHLCPECGDRIDLGIVDYKTGKVFNEMGVIGLFSNPDFEKKYKIKKENCITWEKLIDIHKSLHKRLDNKWR